MSSAVWGNAPRQPSRAWFDVVRFGLSFATGVLLIGLAATSVGAFTVERASVASDGTEGDASSTTSAISADGRHVAFVSSASNLVPDDTNFQLDVFVHDRATGVTERVSVGENGEESTSQSTTPALSGDGRFVAFASPAGNLVAGDDNGRFDVFVRDLDEGTLERVSLASDGSQGLGDSVAPSISANGRMVAFASAARLVPEDTNDTFDVYVRDRETMTTTRASVGTGGAESDNLSLAPRISADGSVVVFHSFASNLVASDTNNVPDVFAHDLAGGTTVRVSVSSAGVQGNQQSIGAAVSGDGRFVGFDSDASTLVAGDVNGRTDVFVHDRLTGTTERVSVASDGTEGNNRSGFVDPPSLSYDGRYVAFTSGAGNLVPDDTNNRVDVMLRDRAAGTTVRVNLAADGSEADGSSTLWANMSADGSVVVYASSATNLVPDDTNFVSDVFAYVDTCGNGALDVGESCDDGNRADGDCCSSSCTAEPAGSACSDGDLCTQTDACDDAGACVGSDPVVCASGGAGQCGSAGACDPATGECVGGPAPDGAACDDGDACTVDDLCLDGACEPGELEPAACVSSFQCYHSASWRRVPWWFSPSKIVVEDRFETATFAWGTTDEVCTALSLPESQSATRLACLDLRRVNGSEKTRNVQVSNALGTHSVRVGKAKQLCLPAAANVPPVDPGLDGYKCYAASTKHFRPVSMRLEDEFGSGTVDVTEPELFCTPASVAGGGVEHHAVHLVCYGLKERRVWGRNADLFRPRSGSVAHALGSDFVSLLWRDHLCVPSAVASK